VAGDREAAEDLVRAVFDASYRRLVGQLYTVCGDLTEAEEVVAEAFSRAVQHRRTFEATSNPEAWLRTVAVNVSRSRHRRQVTGQRLGLLLGLQAHGPGRQPDLGDDRLSLVAVLRTLPAGQREALALHYLADLPVHEVAATLGVPVGTVKARLSRGRRALAAILRNPDEEVTV
jgi:RNA polymerase sigma-70 factor (ECF subfamily)